MNTIEKKRAQRLRFMNELYDIVDGADFQPVTTNEVAQKLGLDTLPRPGDREEVLKIARYLEGEGLIKLSGAGGNVVTLTHRGVCEVEEARGEPDEPTEHFAPISVVYAGTITNSPIQQGSPGATQSLTVVNQSGLQELETFLQSLKQSVDQLELDEDQRAELEADIQTVEAQIASPKPKQEVVRPGLESIRRILEGSASAAVASPLTATVAAIINNVV